MKTLKIFGLPYEMVVEKLKDIVPQEDIEEVNLIIEVHLKEDIETKKRQVYDILEDYIFGEDMDTLEGLVASGLTNRDWTIAVAESCTGGLLGALLANVPGSSHYYKGGIISYWDEIKEKYLKVDEALIKAFSPISAPVAAVMADVVSREFNTEIGVGVTCIAGPGGGTAEKPVGLTYIGVSIKGDIEVYQDIFKGTRNEIRRKAALRALDILRRILWHKRRVRTRII